ncbi:RNA polymerase sigma-70 factor (ECF subfamily) [Tenggerimyces flavus]|nr:RNA polymerase sigma-70 factor (ECF subfamily) [Tenggerimyces flavus]
MPTATERDDFVRSTEPYRRELLAHCYRMLGSIDDAEDVLQETYLRAWRGYGEFEGRASLRTWLYKIATNACLTALEQRGRRALPSGLGAPSDDPDAEPVLLDADWIQPLPTALVANDAQDPASIVAFRDSLRLALIASLQYLPGRQRAALLLREVLAWSAKEVAETLGTSTTAVKSMLQRARAKLDEVAPTAELVEEPEEPEQRALLEQYIAAFENSDPKTIERLLREDATLELIGSKAWYQGRASCLPYLTRHALFTKGDWKMLPTSANGQPAAAAYVRAEDGTHQPLGIAVLAVAKGGLQGITVFPDPTLVERFGFPKEL